MSLIQDLTLMLWFTHTRLECSTSNDASGEITLHICRVGTGVVGHFLKGHLYLTFLLLIRNLYINIIHHLKAWNVLFSNYTIEKTELVPYFEKMYMNARCLRRANSVRCWWCRTLRRALSVMMTEKEGNVGHTFLCINVAIFTF